jgi:hypothetical protein
MPAKYRFSSLVYELASVIESGYASAYYEYLDWNDSQELHDLCHFSRVSIVRKVAFSYLEEWFRRDMRKNPENWLDTGKIDTLEADFRFYRIKIPAFSAYCRKRRTKGTEEEQDVLEEWCYDHDNAFNLLFLRYAKEAEHMLFSNRHFLLDLHSSLAEFLRSPARPTRLPALPIPRVAIPRWAKRAVFFRDHGRCVFCQADLSGVVDLEKEEHFDHMVALADGGVNDPTNLQLTCRRCNLRKGKKAKTEYLYAEWWKDE